MCGQCDLQSEKFLTVRIVHLWAQIWSYKIVRKSRGKVELATSPSVFWQRNIFHQIIKPKVIQHNLTTLGTDKKSRLNQTATKTFSSQETVVLPPGGLLDTMKRKKNKQGTGIQQINKFNCSGVMLMLFPCVIILTNIKSSKSEYLKFSKK